MKILMNDVIALAKAGYTAEQINKMYAVSTPEAPAQPAQQPTGPTAFTEIPNVAPERVPSFDELYKGIAQALRNDNLVTSKQPKEETAEEILASIINPPIKKE